MVISNISDRYLNLNVSQNKGKSSKMLFILIILANVKYNSIQMFKERNILRYVITTRTLLEAVEQLLNRFF